MKSIESTCPYRSPKQAARSEARHLARGENTVDPTINSLTLFDAAKHIDHPAIIETRPERFAITAFLMKQVSDTIFTGSDEETRLPALQERRNIANPMHDDDSRLSQLLKLSMDWSDMDLRSAINTVVHHEQNAPVVQRYIEIAEDIMTYPHTEYTHFAYDSGEENLHFQLNPAHSELSMLGPKLIEWGLESISNDIADDPDAIRRYIISLVPFFEKMAQLEGHHNDMYVRKWYYLSTTAEESGVAVVHNSVGEPMLTATVKETAPEKSFGKPIGCPAGFSFESVATDGIIKKKESTPSLLRHSLVAMINEAHDRGIFDTRNKIS